MDVETDGDAEADVLAVSLTGNSTALVVAASGTGNATSCRYSFDCLAVSGSGRATGSLAASGTGDAYSCSSGLGCIAASGLGEAWAVVPFSLANRCNGRLCAQVWERDAEAWWLAVAPFGNATTACLFVPCVALAPDGHARSWLAMGRSASGVWAIAFAGPANGTVAVSPWDDATSCGSGSCYAVTIYGDATGATPLSVLGACNGLRCFALAWESDATGYYAAATASGDAWSRALAVSLLGDAKGSSFAVAPAGAAEGPVPLSVLGTCNSLSCVAIGFGEQTGWYGAASPDGDARADGLAVGSDGAEGFAALTAEGPATARYLALSPFGPATGVLAVSGTGDATNNGPSGGAVAVSGTGDARGAVAVSGTGNASGPFAFSGRGSCLGAPCVDVGDGERDAAVLAVSPDGEASALASLSAFGAANGTCFFTCGPAISGFGNATTPGPLAASGLGNATSRGRCESGLALPLCIAVSGAGDATSCASWTECAAVSLLGDASGFLAVSGTGDASNPRGRGAAVSGTGEADGDLEVSGCEAAGVCA